MKKFDAIIAKLNDRGVSFERGMSQQDVFDTEAYYGISFPDELKNFYATGLPISSGFYNWRNKSSANISLIKRALEMPIEGLKVGLENGDFWCDSWGLHPEHSEDALEILLMHYSRAPKMIPIYSHRYMPSIPGSKNTPVFSIMQSDIIYFGTDLISYLEIEFGYKQHKDILRASFQQIEFWNDLM